MDRSDDGLDKINDQRDQPKGKILEPDSGGRERAPTLVYPRAGWGLGRSPVSSLTSNLSIIAASAKLIIGIGIVAILYFGRQVFVPLAVAVLLTFVLAPPVRVLRRWRFGRIPSIVTVVLVAFLALFGLGMVLGEQVTHLAAALPKYQDTLTKKIEGLRGAAAEGAGRDRKEHAGAALGQVYGVDLNPYAVAMGRCDPAQPTQGPHLGRHRPPARRQRHGWAARPRWDSL